MNKALCNAAIFEGAALAVSAVPWVLGQPAVGLLVFAASHLPSSLLVFPFLALASSLYNTQVHGGGAWPPILFSIGVGFVLCVQVPVLIAGFRWHLRESAGPARWHAAVRSLRTFATASMAALLVTAICLLLTPIRTSGNCIPLLPGTPPPSPNWHLININPGLRPFNTLSNDHYSTIMWEWWGLFELQSPWRFAMLGTYAAIGLAPGLWIVARRRQDRQHGEGR